MTDIPVGLCTKQPQQALFCSEATVMCKETEEVCCVLACTFSDYWSTQQAFKFVKDCKEATPTAADKASITIKG